MNERNNAPTPSTTQVERMREIIVGRQLGKVEQRLDRLEQQVTQTVPMPDSITRMEDMEARFEAVRDAMQHQMDQIRREFGGEMVHRKQEVHRLAEQIQQAAQAKMAPPVTAQDVTVVENRLIAWVSAWQKSLEQHLQQREQWLIGQLREELQRRPQPVDTTQRDSEAQQQIAAAAQALSSAAGVLSQLAHTFSTKS